MKTNFDGIKKTAEKNFREEIYTQEEKETWWKVIVFFLAMFTIGYMIGYHIVYKLIIQ